MSPQIHNSVPIHTADWAVRAESGPGGKAIQVPFCSAATEPRGVPQPGDWPAQFPVPPGGADATCTDVPVFDDGHHDDDVAASATATTTSGTPS